MPLPLLALGAAKFFRSLPLGVYLGIAAAAGFGLLQWKHAREVSGLRKDIAAAEQQRDEQLRQKLEFKAALADVTANRDALASEIRRQNEAIAQLQLAKTAAERSAALAAVRALEAGKTVANDLRAPTTTVKPGNVPMNEWLAARFAQ